MVASAVAAAAGWFANGVIYLVAVVLALLIAAKASAWSSAATTPNTEATERSPR